MGALQQVKFQATVLYQTLKSENLNVFSKLPAVITNLKMLTILSTLPCLIIRGAHFVVFEISHTKIT